MNGLKAKKILIIASGVWQIPVIKKAKEMGLIVISTDKDPNAPGFAFADFHETVDITDLEGTLEVAKKYKVDAVITEQTDVAVPTAAYVAEKLGLPGIGYEVALRATNKFLMRETCKKAGIPIPKYKRVNTLKEATDAADEIGYPVVIKPVDNQSSRGVFTIKNISDMKRFFHESISQSRAHSILIEEKLIGTEITVEGFVTDNGPVVLAISEKKHLPPPSCIATTLLYAPSFNKKRIDEIKQMNIDIIKAIGITMGITHAEFMITKDGPRIIEIAARGGGTKISSHIVPAISGVDVVKGLIFQACGYNFKIEKVNSRVAILEFFILPEGRLKRLDGIDNVKAMRGIIDIDIPLKLGDLVKPVMDDRSRHGYFIAVADTREELLRIAETIKHTVKIEVEKV
jgi:carbamoyl-phosphate synthase large subunit